MAMFCYQCEQTASKEACTRSGICGKKPVVALLQDQLISKLISLSCAVKPSHYSDVTEFIVDSLFSTVTNVNFDYESIENSCLQAEKLIHLYGDKFIDIDLADIWNMDEDLRSLKSLILFGLKGMAAYAHHARTLGYVDEQVDDFFITALKSLYLFNDADKLLNLALETGSINYNCMQLLDKANTESYGNPLPVEVFTDIEKGPFIVVSGHDLLDLDILLKQTEGTGINVYTHGEMLPCHGYPELKKFKHLKGHFGTAWQNQQKELANLPAPILFTTNCIMPVDKKYSDRVFTTSLVRFGGVTHIDSNNGKKDFSPIIKKSLELKGYAEKKIMTGINGGNKLITGFGHAAVLGVADKIIESIKKGDIKRLFLVGGCDGAASGRNYYTEFVKKTPDDSIILTLACGKFRFNDIDLGYINGIPRIIDMGQCNDAYSAVKVALALCDVFNCDVNDLPLTLVLSWYEQKAVAILLTLLALGIKNIYLGPTLPAFISKNVLNIIVDRWGIKPISNPEADLEAILS